MYSHMWSTITKDWVTLPNNAGKVFMQSLNQQRSKFKRQKEHPDYGERLLSAVVEFGAKRIRFCFNKFDFLCILKHVIFNYSFSNICTFQDKVKKNTKIIM